MSTTSRDDAAAPTSAPADPFADAPSRPRTPASAQDGTHPRPQLLRDAWADLSGPWGFRYDDADEGLAEGWHRWPAMDRTITVPFPPESPASGIGDPAFHPVVWYHRVLTRADFDEAGIGADPQRTRLLLHFGAVDYRAKVWIDGVLLGEHEGGHTPFSFDVSESLGTAVLQGETTHDLVVRVEDDPFDVTQPRGKQDWHLEPHAIWYERTTGIWQTVWLEAVPETSVRTVRWVPDLPSACIRVSVEVAGRLEPGLALRIAVSYDGRALGSVEVPVAGRTVQTSIALPSQSNGQAYEQLLWSPETPRLIDATVSLVAAGGGGAPVAVDRVDSYLGLRSATLGRGAFLLNDRPYYVRSVLNQGYWPESHLAAPSVAALRREVELIKELGFNATRVHQKVEDPRFLFWADRLGLLVWGEVAGAYEFSPTAVTRLMKEWMEAVERDVSHPSIVTWVPVNESWGVQHISHDPAQQAYARALADVTRALDPTRPVISNDGWEHQNSDIVSVHDYEPSGSVVAARYADAAARAELLTGMGPAGRRILLDGEVDGGQPVMLTEFGGIKYTVNSGSTSAHVDDGDAWGYSSAGSGREFVEALGSLLDGVRASRFLAGYCYTQLTDTVQEANGLLTEAREPKVPMEQLRAAIVGPTA